MKYQRVINTTSYSSEPGCLLSNFAAHSFVLDDIYCAGLEGFLQSLKTDDKELQSHIQHLLGSDAHFAGKTAKLLNGKSWLSSQTLYWNSRAFARRSDEYDLLITRAYDAAFDQNELFRDALRQTAGYELTHTFDKRIRNLKESTVLTVDEFLNQLNRLRQKAIDK